MVLELIAHCSINLMIHLTFLQVTQLLPKWQDGGGVATMTFFSDGAYHPLAICQRPAASFVQKVSERRTESLTAAGQASCRRPDPEPQMRQSKHQHRRRHRPEYFFFALLSNLFAKSASDDRSFPNSIMVKLEILLPNVFNLALHKVF